MSGAKNLRDDITIRGYLSSKVLRMLGLRLRKGRRSHYATRTFAVGCIFGLSAAFQMDREACDSTELRETITTPYARPLLYAPKGQPVSAARMLPVVCHITARQPPQDPRLMQVPHCPSARRGSN